MLQGAEAVYIVPKLVKGGFIFGAEGGDGVLLHRTGHGWSTPNFYGMGSASFGLQAGLEQAELVFIINTERALRGIEKGEFKLGAGAGLTVVTLSGGAEGATTAHGGDIVVWTSGTGAYGGLTFNGSVIKQDKDDERGTRHRPGSPGAARATWPASGKQRPAGTQYSASQAGRSFGIIAGAPVLSVSRGNPQ